MKSSGNSRANSDDLSRDETNAVDPKNVIWLHTIYEDILKNLDLLPEVPLKGTEVRCPLLNAAFHLELRKTSPEILTISCNRRLLSEGTEIDDGYFLRFYFNVTGIQQETIATEMHSGDSSATAYYFTHMFSVSPPEKPYISTIKCVIRMIETTESSGKLLDELEQKCEKFAKTLSKSQLKNMSYLVKRPKLKGIFTGRENADIFLTKLSYIERAVPYSKQLAMYMKTRKSSCPDLKDLHLDEILCYIGCGEKRSIREEECITLYLNSTRIGLQFLNVIVSDYIISNINKDYVVDVLEAADWASDRRLFKVASEFFLVNISDILLSDKWERLGNVYARSILHNLKLELTGEDPYVAPGLFEEKDEYEY